MNLLKNGAILLIAVIIGILAWYILIFGWSNYPITTLIIILFLVGGIVLLGHKSFIDYW